MNHLKIIFCGVFLISTLAGGCNGKMDGIPLEGAALKGKGLYKSKGCDICHSIDGSSKPGPTFAGLYGSRVEIITGSGQRTVTADEGYLRKSIISPKEDIVKGFDTVAMVVSSPPLTDEEIDALIAFIKAMKGSR